MPFRAAHTPSERSDFAQPDVALTLTTLSYYYDGLSRHELLAALGVLLRMGLNAQRDFYREWLRLSGPGIPAGRCEGPGPKQQRPTRAAARTCQGFLLYRWRTAP